VGGGGIIICFSSLFYFSAWPLPPAGGGVGELGGVGGGGGKNTPLPISHPPPPFKINNPPFAVCSPSSLQCPVAFHRGGVPRDSRWGVLLGAFLFCWGNFLRGGGGEPTLSKTGGLLFLRYLSDGVGGGTYPILGGVWAPFFFFVFFVCWGVCPPFILRFWVAPGLYGPRGRGRLGGGGGGGWGGGGGGGWVWGANLNNITHNHNRIKRRPATVVLAMLSKLCCGLSTQQLVGGWVGVRGWVGGGGGKKNDISENLM